jgi:UDP-2,3-diacylglucosamine hydrolase
VKRQFDGTGYADADAELAARWLNAARTRTLVHGHTHRPGSEAWPGGLTRHVLTDWDLDQGQRAEVLRLSERGFERIAPMSP